MLLRRRPDRAAERAAVEQRAAAERVRLEWLAAGHGWNELHRQLVHRLTPPAIRADDELAELAQTIATLTGGLVTIEDTSARVLAYSRSSDEVDELRRLSILGRSGPAQYLALLREWGVYDRLSSSEEVVEIAEHPESGVRRRLAVGVFAGERQLATIWLQQGSGDFEPHAEQALLGAARITAAQLVSRGRPAGSGTELAALLGTGPDHRRSAAAPAVPARLGRAARQPCAVAVAELGPQPRDAGHRRIAAGRAGRHPHRARRRLPARRAGGAARRPGVRAAAGPGHSVTIGHGDAAPGDGRGAPAPGPGRPRGDRPDGGLGAGGGRVPAGRGTGARRRRHRPRSSPSTPSGPGCSSRRWRIALHTRGICSIRGSAR